MNYSTACHAQYVIIVRSVHVSFFSRYVDTCRTNIVQKISKFLMERKSHYDSILDRSKLIMWQDDGYVDLQSTPLGDSTHAEAEGELHHINITSLGTSDSDHVW